VLQGMVVYLDSIGRVLVVELKVDFEVVSAVLVVFLHPLFLNKTKH
jgi:hypothetical protein